MVHIILKHISGLDPGFLLGGRGCSKFWLELVWLLNYWTEKKWGHEPPNPLRSAPDVGTSSTGTTPNAPFGPRDSWFDPQDFVSFSIPLQNLTVISSVFNSAFSSQLLWIQVKESECEYRDSELIKKRSQIKKGTKCMTYSHSHSWLLNLVVSDWNE